MGKASVCQAPEEHGRGRRAGRNLAGFGSARNLLIPVELTL